MSGSSTITLGKDVNITGVSNARSCTVSSSTSEIDTTKLGDSSRSFSKGLIEQTIEIECIDDPGCEAGDSVTIGGTDTGNAEFVITSVVQSEPIDGIVTYTVSGSRASS